jgi:hypothetical protein
LDPASREGSLLGAATGCPNVINDFARLEVSSLAYTYHLNLYKILQLKICTAKETDVSMQTAIAEDDTAIDELQDALARVKAQAHVVRLAMSGMGDERDIMSSLDAITDELHQAEAMLKR